MDLILNSYLTVSTLIAKCHKDERGVISLEYAAMGALLLIAIVGALTVFNQGLNDLIRGIGAWLTGTAGNLPTP